MGLAFKARTDDVRDSPALALIMARRKAGAEIRAYDPEASENARKVLGDDSILFVARLADAVRDCDGAVIATEWDEFRKANWPTLAASMSTSLLVDLRNIFTLQEAGEWGISYVSLGRDPILKRTL